MTARFCRYIKKVFDFGRQIHTLRDARKRPRIPTAALWGSVFFLMRRRSLRAIKQATLTQAAGYVLELMGLGQLSLSCES